MIVNRGRSELPEVQINFQGIDGIQISKHVGSFKNAYKIGQISSKNETSYRICTVSSLIEIPAFEELILFIYLQLACL